MKTREVEVKTSQAGGWVGGGGGLGGGGGGRGGVEGLGGGGGGSGEKGKGNLGFDQFPYYRSYRQLLSRNASSFQHKARPCTRSRLLMPELSNAAELPPEKFWLGPAGFAKKKNWVEGGVGGVGVGRDEVGWRWQGCL